MNYLTKVVAVAAVALTGMAGAVSAVTYPTFVIDGAASSVDVTRTGGGGFFGSASVSASMSAGLDGYSWTPTSATDSITISNLIDWTVSGSGFLGNETFDVEVTLAFSQPDAASGTGTGSGRAATLFGVISGGSLSWASPDPTISFAQGSVLTMDLEGGSTIGLGNSTSTGVTLTGSPIAPVPLPAAGLLLLTAVGGLGVMSRRRKLAAA